MPGPTLEQMLAAHDKRKAAPQLGLFQLLKQILYPNPQAPLNQPIPQYDAEGNPVDPRTLNDLGR